MTAKPWERANSNEAVPVWTYRQEPAGRVSSLESDVWVPVLQSVFMALAWSILAALALAGLVWATGWPWWILPAGLAATWAGVFAWHTTATVKERRELLWRREEVEQRDIDGDGVVGRPRPTTLQVEIVNRGENGGQRVQIVDFGVSPDQAAALARGLLAGKTFSEAEWTGAGRPFSKAEFRNLRGELLEMGLLEWRNPQAPAQGVELTPAGRAVMTRLAQDTQEEA